jgi:uncharacterized C2H2 Zn-finger protein
MLKCNNCNKMFKYNSDLLRHTNRKNACNNLNIIPKIFKCQKCDKIFATNGNLTRHISGYCIGKKQAPQSSHNPPQIQNFTHINDNNNDKIICNLCNKSFARKDALVRHQKQYCKIRKQIKKHTNDDQGSDKQFVDEMKEMKKEINDLKIKNEELTKNMYNNKPVNKTINSNSNNINNNNTTINNTVNIKLVANSKEDMDFITNNDAYKFICRSANAVPELIKKLNFDKDKPENHNIYLPNFGSNTVCIYNGDKWERASLYDHLDDMLDSKNNFLSSIHDDLKEKYSEHQKNAVRGFDRYLKWYSDDPKYKFSMYKRMRYILYNNRDIVLDTKKLNDQPNDQPNDNKRNELIKELFNNELLDEFIEELNTGLNTNDSSLCENIKNDMLNKFMNEYNDEMKNPNIMNNVLSDDITNDEMMDSMLPDDIECDPDLINDLMNDSRQTVIVNSEDEFIEDSEDF